MIKRMLKNKNKGFSMLELIIAVGIMSILVVTVGMLMTTSSSTYNRLSVDTQLQSEAQLVANSIGNFAMDSISANNVPADTTGFSADIVTDSGKCLVLNNDGDSKRYTVVRDSSTNKLMLYTEDGKFGGTYTNKQEAGVLGEHIKDFVVNTDRIDVDNILTFDLTYEKRGREYTGNYQVLLRNRQYTPEPNVTGEPDQPSLRGLTLTPTLVYVDIKDNKLSDIQQKRAASLSSMGRQSDSDGLITFEGKPIYTGKVTEDKMSCDWAMSEDVSGSPYFNLSSATGKTVDMAVTNSGAQFKDINTYNFKVVCSKDTLSRSANILVRIVKKVTLRATSGVSPWKSSYEKAPYNANKYPLVDDANYAMAGSTVNLSATLEQYNLTDGLDWTLQWAAYDATTDKDKWEYCTDTTVARLASYDTTGTTNSLIIGNTVLSQKIKLRVVAYSKFDPSKYDEIIIGVAPSWRDGSDGQNSRGFYIDFDYWLTNIWSADGYPGRQSDKPAMKKLVSYRLGTGNNMDKQEHIDKAFKLDPATGKLYVDYSVFQYSKEQSKTFYTQGITLYLYDVTYIDINNKTQTVSKIEYQILPLTVDSAGSSVICVKKGGSEELFTKFNYSNINSSKLFGIFPRQHATSDTLPVGADKFKTNVNKTGMESADKYLSITYNPSELGDVYHYVDVLRLTVGAKNNLKTYPVNYIDVRVTFEDFYNVDQGNLNSYEDYKVYIANVSNRDVYIPGPNAVKATAATDIGWPSGTISEDASKGTAVKGIDTSGNIVTNAKVYKEGNGYKLDLGGTIYTYNKTYDCWK